MHKVKIQTIIIVFQKCQSNKRRGLIGLSPLPLATSWFTVASSVGW